MTEKDLDIAIEKCERIMEFDTRTLKDPESENGFLFDSVYDLLKFLRQLRFDTDTNVCGTDTISRAAALKGLEDLNIASFYEENEHSKEAYTEVKTMLKALPSAQPGCEDYVKIPETGIGDLSDGYHTFNGLYKQRMILFAALVKAYKEKAWKSYRHEDGEYCFGGGWFIVGIDTPEGSYTYHYKNKYWDMFDCVDLPMGKHWDGHTEADAETRLMSLPSAQPEPLSDVYMKAVWTWLVDYQIKAAELKGRYTPYEVLSWVVNDWRKEHERSD